jgi:hypothetical protein
MQALMALNVDLATTVNDGDDLRIDGDGPRRRDGDGK